MSDDRAVFSDEEFALILHKAAELAEPADPRSHASGGLTLAEMKAAAAQAGFDPALVGRAARLLRSNASAAPSLLERLIGGRTRFGSEDHFPIVLDEAGAARLLSAIQIGIGRSGDGYSGPTGLTWRGSDDGGGVLSLTALPDQEGTSVTVDLDRRGTVMLIGTLTAVGSFLALAIGGTVAGEIVPGLEAVGGLFGGSAVLALARSYWASSTRAANDRLSRVMESLNRFLTPGSATFVGALEKPVESAGTDDAVPRAD